MNKKIMIIGSLALILAMGLVFAGCKQADEGGVVVGFKGFGVNGDDVTFEQSYDGEDETGIWVINWSATDGALGYEVVFKGTNIKTIEKFGGGEFYDDLATIDYTEPPTNNKVFGVTFDGTGDKYDKTTDSTDADRWSAVVTLKLSELNVADGQLGVVAIPVDSSKNLDIVWSEKIPVFDDN